MNISKTELEHLCWRIKAKSDDFRRGDSEFRVDDLLDDLTKFLGERGVTVVPENTMTLAAKAVNDELGVNDQSDWQEKWKRTQQAYKDVLPAEGETPIHCDSFILHAPGLCSFCDKYGSRLQAKRRSAQVRFTGQAEPADWRMCPSEVMRPVEVSHRWPRNRPAKESDYE